ncbi:MAG: hypothetical protein IKH33_07865 [Bacteroidales bacterium]|nr:hypothetical protein [Bacteroidales bacterium]
MEEKRDRTFNIYGGAYIEKQENNIYGGTNYINGAEPKTDGDEGEEKALRECNEVLAVRLHGHRVLFVPLYEFVADCFLKKMLKGKNRWCALRAFLKDKGLLAVEDSKAFAEQMNGEAWFGWVEEDKQCSVEALKVYAAVDFGRERMSEMQFDACVHGSNAKYAGYCELKLVYDKLCDAWDEARILER